MAEAVWQCCSMSAAAATARWERRSAVLVVGRRYPAAVWVAAAVEACRTQAAAEALVVGRRCPAAA
ncbi:MAG: hypothetical protein ACJ786_11170 [Catenulispora sp.]